MIHGCYAYSYPETLDASGFQENLKNFEQHLSNMISGNDFADVGKKKINSIYKSPDSESDFMPMFNFEFRYTFADSRTQIYAGNTLEDFLRFDLTAQAGVRQEMPDSSVVSASFVFTSTRRGVGRSLHGQSVP